MCIALSSFFRVCSMRCERLQLRLDELTFNNYVVQVEEWLKLNSRVGGLTSQ
jgi:hypothetical protein